MADPKRDFTAAEIEEGLEELRAANFDRHSVVFSILHRASLSAAGRTGEAKKQVVVGTIGHVDHGKTSLTAAVTKILAASPPRPVEAAEGKGEASERCQWPDDHSPSDPAGPGYSGGDIKAMGRNYAVPSHPLEAGTVPVAWHDRLEVPPLLWPGWTNVHELAKAMQGKDFGTIKDMLSAVLFASPPLNERALIVEWVKARARALLRDWGASALPASNALNSAADAIASGRHLKGDG